MTTTNATWKNGQIVPDAPVDWPEGCRLLVEPALSHESIGMTEDEQGADSESIARWISEFDAIPPMEMSAEEEARWQEDRRIRGELEKASFQKRAELLRRNCE